MLTGYQFDPALNQNKLFQCTPPTQIDVSKLPKLPKDWCIQLEAILYQTNNSLEKKSLEKHLGTDSRYELKKILAEQLQLIYYRLQGNLDTELDPLSEDGRTALLSKLIEGLTECTPGFHNRVNTIVDSFQKPRNLVQLLYVLRKRIVEDVAHKLTNEIHAQNQVSVVANKEKLGIEPNLPNDPHLKNLIDEKITDALRKTFQEKFTPFNLPSLLCHALMGLIPELELEKNKAEGLCLETTEKIAALIQCYVPNSIKPDPLDWQKYFNIYTDKQDVSKVYIVNVNWNAMYRYFYQELSQENYFKQTPEVHNLIDGAYYNLSLEEPDPSDYESGYISQLFEQKDYFTLLAQLEELQTRFADYYQRVTRNPILIQRSPEFIPYLQQQFAQSKEYPSELMQGFHLLTTLDLKVDKSILLKIADGLQKNQSLGYNPLMLAAYNDPSIVEGILTFLIRHQEIIGLDIYQPLFLEKNQADWNALMLAVKHQPIVVKQILSFFDICFLSSRDTLHKNFGINLLQQIFRAKERSHYNALMLAAYEQVEIAIAILNFLTKHISSFDKSTLQGLFTEKQSNNYNVLALIAANHPEYVKEILCFIEQHIENFDSKTLGELFFSSPQGTTYTALMLAANSQTEASQVILNFIEQHIESFDPKAIRQMLLEKNKRNYTALMLAAQTQAKSVKAILTFIERHPKIFEAQLITEILLAKDEFSTTALMLAANSQTEASQVILNFIEQHIESFDPKAIRQMLLEKNKRNYTALMLAAQTQAKSVKAILTFIERHPKIFEAQLITEILLAKDEFSTTALMLAAEKQPEAMIGLVYFIHKHIDTLNIEAVQELVFKKIHDYEASMGVFFGGKFNTQKTLLMQAERKSPQATDALLSFIDEHMGRLMLKKCQYPQATSTLDEPTEQLEPDILTQLLSEKDGDGNNPFMRACTKHPRTMNGTLHFIANTTAMEIDAFSSIQTEIADFIFMQLARMSLKELEEKTIINKILFSNSDLLLAHFNFTENYFAKCLTNLAYVTEQLFEHYLEGLEARKANTLFSFFTWRYSTRPKMEAAQELKKIVSLHPFSSQQLSALEKNSRYCWALTEGRLGKLFASYYRIAGANNLAEAPCILANNNSAPIIPIDTPNTSKEASAYLKHSIPGF